MFYVVPWARSGTWDARQCSTTDGRLVVPSAKLQPTGPCKPGGSTIAIFGSAVCAGRGAQTPWYNLTALSTGWAHELAAVLHQDYGHEVLNLAQHNAGIGDISNKLFEQTVVPLKPDVVVIAFSLGNEAVSYTHLTLPTNREV